MPNHVDQDLTVAGESVTLQEFLDFAKGIENGKELILSTEKFVPYPVELGFNDGGYEWCIRNWGTKWGIYDATMLTQRLDKKRGRLQFNFHSAWSPPLPVILAMGERFKTLKFKLKYYEQGMQFKGTFVVQNGEVTEDATSAYRGHRGG